MAGGICICLFLSFPFVHKIFRSAYPVPSQAKIADLSTGIISNIEQSCWIEQVSGHHIKLFSHSIPDIREYYIENGVLFFNNGTKISALYPDLADNSHISCTGTGRTSSRYRSVSFVLNRMNDKKPLNIEASSRESWDIVYFSAGTKGKPAYGTKSLPFHSLETAQKKAYPGDAIVGLPGHYTLSGRLVLEHDHLFFSQGSEVSFAAGTELVLPPGADIYIGGPVMFRGTKGSPVSFRSSGKNGPGWNVYITGFSGEISMSHTILDGMAGFFINSPDFVLTTSPLEIHVNIMDSFITPRSTGGIVANDCSSVSIQDTTFETTGRPLFISNSYYTQKPFRHILKDNSFICAGGPSGISVNVAPGTGGEILLEKNVFRDIADFPDPRYVLSLEISSGDITVDLRDNAALIRGDTPRTFEALLILNPPDVVEKGILTVEGNTVTSR